MNSKIAAKCYIFTGEFQLYKNKVNSSQPDYLSEVFQG